MRAGLPVAAEPMAPVLAGRLFDRDRKPGQADGGDRWEKCAKSQWWLASQLASGKIDKMTALTLYRYSTMADAREFAPATVGQKAAAARPSAEKQAYPPVAAYFNVEGSTTMEAHTDEQGKFLKAQVVARKITVPGVYDNPPIAFESLLDAASLDYAEKRHKYPPSNNPTVRFEIDWHLSEDDNEVR